MNPCSEQVYTFFARSVDMAASSERQLPSCRASWNALTRLSTSLFFWYGRPSILTFFGAVLGYGMWKHTDSARIGCFPMLCDSVIAAWVFHFVYSDGL